MNRRTSPDLRFRSADNRKPRPEAALLRTPKPLNGPRNPFPQREKPGVVLRPVHHAGEEAGDFAERGFRLRRIHAFRVGHSNKVFQDSGVFIVIHAFSECLDAQGGDDGEVRLRGGAFPAGRIEVGKRSVAPLSDERNTRIVPSSLSFVDPALQTASRVPSDRGMTDGHVRAFRDSAGPTGCMIPESMTRMKHLASIEIMARIVADANRIKNAPGE